MSNMRWAAFLILGAAALTPAGCTKKKSSSGSAPIPNWFAPDGGAEHRLGDAAFSVGGDGFAVWMEASASDITKSRVLYASYHGGVWSAEAELAAQANDPHVATDGTRFVVVWCGLDGGTPSIFARRYDGTGWGAATLLETASGYAYHPRIASSGTTFCAAWSQHDGVRYRVYTSLYTVGTDNWSLPDPRDAAANNSASQPEIAASSAGYAATWSQNNALGNNNIAADVYKTGAWQGAGELNTTAVDGCTTPRIASNGTGYAVTWYQTVTGNSRIYARVHDGSVWDVAGDHQLNPAGVCGLPHIASNGSGYCAAWPQAGVTKVEVFAALYDSGTWATPGASTGATTGDALGACVASAGTGYAVTWEQDDGINGYNDYASFYDGPPWTTPAPIESGAGACSGSPIVQWRDASTYAFFWAQIDGPASTDTLTVYTRTRTTSGTWGAETNLVGKQWYGSSMNPQMAVGSGGTALAVWEQYHNGTKGVYGSFGSSGNWGAPFVIADRGASPAAASRGSSYLVAWVDGHDVSARLYDGAAWGAPQILDNSTSDASGPRIAAQGTTYCVTWQQTGNVYTNLYHDTVAPSWDGATEIDSTTDACSEPQIAANGSGYCVIWKQFVTPNNRLFARIYAGGWAALPTNQLDAVASAVASPSIASNGTGYCAAWIQNDRVYTNQWNVTWAVAQQIDDNTGNIGSAAGVASNGTGYAAVWTQGALTRHVYANRFDAGAWTGAVLIEPFTNHSDEPRIAGSPSGYGVTWRQYDGARYNLYANVYAGGSWSPNTPVLEDGSLDVDANHALGFDGIYYLSLYCQYDTADPLRLVGWWIQFWR